MTETIWVALIAVGGTALGAALTPILALVRDATTSKSNEKSRRIRAAAGFSLALHKYARTDPNRFESYIVTKMRAEALEARFRMARVIPRGAGQVDRFAEAAIEVIGAQSSAIPRELAAQHAATKLLDWARGDVPPRSLTPFAVKGDGNEYEIVKRSTEAAAHRQPSGEAMDVHPDSGD